MARKICALLLVAAAGVMAAGLDGDALPSHPPNASLVYIPMHVSEPASHLQDLIECALSPAVAPSVTGERFTILLVLSGASPDPGRVHALGALLRAAADALPRPRPRVEVATVALGGRDAYDRDGADFSGPNRAFYSTFLGTVHARHVAGHDLVQQLETDVCATRAGWLDSVLAAARARPTALVVGAKLAGDCVWVEAHRECERLANRGDDGVLVSHVNGNALYRVGRDLTTLLTLAQDALGDTEPFDLALWRAAVAVGWQGRVVGTPQVVNVGAPVDEARFRQAAYHGVPAVLVHAPRRLRMSGVAAAAARVPHWRVATVVGVWRADVATGLLRHVTASLAGAGVIDVLYAAADDAAYAAASALAPYRVLRGDAANVAAALTARGRALFLVSCRSAVLDGGAYGDALAALSGKVWGGGCSGGRALPIFLPPWPPAVPAAVAAWANMSSAVTLPSALAAARVPCAPLPSRSFGSVRANSTVDPIFVSADGLPRRAAVRALTVAGAWRGTARDARAAWSKGEAKHTRAAEG